MNLIKLFIVLMILIGVFINLGWQYVQYNKLNDTRTNDAKHTTISNNHEKTGEACLSILKYTLDIKLFCQDIIYKESTDSEFINTKTVCNYLANMNDDLYAENFIIKSTNKVNVSNPTSLAARGIISMLWSAILTKFSDANRLSIKNRDLNANFYDKIDFLSKYLPIAIYSGQKHTRHAIFMPFTSLFLEESIEETFNSYVSIYYDFFISQSTTYGEICSILHPDTIILPIKLDNYNVLTLGMYYELHKFFTETYSNSEDDTKVPLLFCTIKLQNQLLKYKLDNILLEKGNFFIHLRKQFRFCGHNPECTGTSYNEIQDYNITLLTFKKYE